MKSEIQKRAEVTGYSMESLTGTPGQSRGELNLTLWTKVPKIEIYTSRGQSFIVEGDDARKLAAYFRDAIVRPILGE